MVKITSNLDLKIFYRKKNLPLLSLGDTVEVTVYLELPKTKEVGEGENKKRKKKSVFKSIKAL